MPHASLERVCVRPGGVFRNLEVGTDVALELGVLAPLEGDRVGLGTAACEGSVAYSAHLVPCLPLSPFLETRTNKDPGPAFCNLRYLILTYMKW